MYNHNFTWGFHLLINKLLKTSHSDQFTKHYLISFYFENEMSNSIDGQLIFLSSIRLNFLNNVWGNTDWNWSSIGQRSDISSISGIGILLLLDTSFNISNGSKILYYNVQMFEFVHHSFGGIRLQINKDRNMCVISSSDLFWDSISVVCDSLRLLMVFEYFKKFFKISKFFKAIEILGCCLRFADVLWKSVQL